MADEPFADLLDVEPDEDFDVPGRISSSPFERPRLAAGRALALDPGGFVRALFAPESLTPAQRVTLADKMGVQGAGSLHKTLLNTITNPAVLWGAVMAFKYPIPLAGQMFKYAPWLGGKLRKVGPLMRRISGIDGLYKGTPIPELYKKILNETDLFKRTFNERIGLAVDRYQRTTGQVLSRRTEILLSAKLDGLDDVAFRGSATLFKPITNLGKPFDRMVGEIRGVTDDLWSRVFGTVNDRARLLAASEQGLTASQLARMDKLKALSRKLPKGVERELMTEATARATGKLTGPQKEALRELGRISGKRTLTTLEVEQLQVIAKRQGDIKRQIFSQLRSVGMDPKDFTAPKLAKFYPHRVPKDVRQFSQETIDLLAQTGELEKSQQILGAATRVGTKHALPRQQRMIADPADLKEVRDLLINPETVQEFTALVDRGVLPYSLKFFPTMSAYTHSLARADAWTLQGLGGKLTGALTELMKPGPVGSASGPSTAIHANNVVRGRMMLDSYIPTALGKMTFKQMMANAKWTQSKLNFLESLQKGRIATAMDKAGLGDAKNFLVNALAQDRGLFSLKNVSGRTASFLYLSTLGLNPVSAGYNMLQTALTTVPTIGPRATFEGAKRVFNKVPRYFGARQSGMGHEQALAKVFPEFFEQGLVANPLIDEALLKNLNRSWEVTLSVPTEVGRRVDKVKDAMMLMFQTTENLNRLVAFEGGIAKAGFDGLKGPAVGEFARRVVETTQFLGGPANVPAFLRDSNPLIRQFGTFPFRTLEFLLGPGTELGSAAQTGALGRNFGTLGRAMLTSGLAFEAGQQFLDTDLSHGLIWGALPAPHPNAPFAPAPFVPPALSIAGGIGLDILKGETTNIRRSIPLLIPGGLGLSRVASMFAPSVSEFIGREFADYDNPTEDGRIPVFTNKGQLKGYRTPMQMWAQTLLVGGDPGQRKEKDLQRFLVSQRDRIRAMRRKFLDALSRNDIATAQGIREQYDVLYPGMGGLRVKETDARAVQLRQMVPRLERFLETLPKETRSQFGQIVAAALAEEAETLLGVDPALLSSVPTSRARDAHRNPPPRNIMEELAQRQADLGLSRRQAPQSFIPGAAGGNPGNAAQRDRAKFGRQTDFLSDRPVTPFTPSFQPAETRFGGGF